MEAFSSLDAANQPVLRSSWQKASALFTQNSELAVAPRQHLVTNLPKTEAKEQEADLKMLVKGRREAVDHKVLDSAVHANPVTHPWRLLLDGTKVGQKP